MGLPIFVKVLVKKLEISHILDENIDFNDQNIVEFSWKLEDW